MCDLTEKVSVKVTHLFLEAQTEYTLKIERALAYGARALSLL